MLELRQHLAEAKIALRAAKDALETAKIVATMEVGGKNEAERKTNAAVALLENRAYAEALAHVRDCEATVERAEADIAEQEYQLRVREVAARERLAEALKGRRVDDAVADAYDYTQDAEAAEATYQYQSRQPPLPDDWYKQR